MERPIRLAFKLIFMAALIAIAWASLVPQDVRPQTGFWDGWEHLAAYFVLGITGFIAFPSPSHRLKMLVLIIVYGIVLEVMQGFLPGRMPGVVDALANSIGAGLAFLAVWSFDRLRP